MVFSVGFRAWCCDILDIALFVFSYHMGHRSIEFFHPQFDFACWSSRVRYFICSFRKNIQEEEGYII